MDDRCGHESYNETDLTTPADLIWNRDTKKSWIRSLLGLDGECPIICVPGTGSLVIATFSSKGNYNYHHDFYIHRGCVGVDEEPNNEWFCLQCSSSVKRQRI